MRIVLPLVVCVIAISMAVWGQTTGGNIRGVVTDPEDRPLPGVTVTISSESLLGQTRTAYTNELGVFRFPSVPVGKYQVELTMQGFETVRVENVDVQLNATANVPVGMNLSKMAEAITTIGESPLIDVHESGLSSNYSDEILEEVPTQHSQFVLMQTSPGVTASTGDAAGDRTIALGSNMQSNAWHVDGVDLSAPETGSVWMTVNPFLIDEVQVMGVGASAEYGNHTGAVFNVVTKKGSNDFHGAANYYILTDGLTDNLDAYAYDAQGERVALDLDPAVSGFSREEYRLISGQLGGPILKDRLWFFGGVSTGRDASAQPGVVPELAAQVAFKSDKYDMKANGLIGENHEVSGFFHWEEWDSPNTLTPEYQLEALPGEGGTNPAWGASLVSTISQNLLVEVGYSGWWTDDFYDSVVGAPLADPFIDYTPPDKPHSYYSGGVWYPWDYETWRNTFRSKVTYYADDFLNSEHEFKFGVQYSRGDANTSISIGANGFYTVHYAYYDYYAAYNDLYRVYQQPFQYGGENRELGFFLDDTITVNDRLTLNLGLRFDHNTGTIPDYDRLTVGTPSVAQSGNFKATGEIIPGQEVANWNLVSPRIGFVFQPFEGGRTKIQGSFGVYYDHNVSGNWDYPPPQLPIIEAFRFNPDTGVFDIPYYTDAVEALVSSDIDPPRTLQYSVGFEHQFADSFAAGVQYVYKDSTDLVGWEIIGGSYEPLLFTDPFTGTEYILFDEVEAATIQKGNRPGNFCELLPQASACDGFRNEYWQTYHGVLFTFEKRFSDNWGLNANYTWSRSEGQNPRALEQTQFNPFYGSRNGSDANNWLNASGRLQGDRPHMFRVQAVFFNLPGDLQASVLADFETGRHFTRQFFVGGLTQGRQRVIMERDLRLDPIESIDVTVGRRFNIGGAAQFRLEGTIYNIFNSDNALALQDLRLAEGDVFIPSFWTQPRRLEVRLGFQF
ncbi:TonB-dependent receptor [bacterium]|nr:TonB-dependent receptor [bacterium]MCI0602664.1 TonB-dependent receptor [bacterium]